MRFFSCIFTFVLGFSMVGQAQIFQEDFGASFSTTYLGLPNWSSCRSTSSNSSSGPCGGFPDYNVYISNNQNLTTESMAIPGTGYCLNFDYSYNSALNLPKVQIGTGGPFCFSGTMTWTDLATLTQTATCDGVSYSLDAYAGQTIWIRFLAGSSFTSWYIDDIAVDNVGCSGGGGGGCTTIVFSDGFSDNSIGAPEWTSVSSTFTSTGTPCNGGDSRAYFSTFSSPAEVVTTSIDLTGATVAQLSLDYYMAAAAFSFQCAYVEISTTGSGGPWTDVSPTYTDPDGSCQSAMTDISAYVGGIVNIRIRRSSTSQTFYFDNVEVCTDGSGAVSNYKWADNFNDNDLVLDYAGNDGDEDCAGCGPWVLGGGSTLELVPAAGWNGSSNTTEAFPASMANVYYTKLDRNEWIESPTIDMSGMTGLKISFHAKSSSPGTGGGDTWSFSDRLRLQIWDGASWITVTSMRDDLSAAWSGPDDYITAALPLNYYCFTAYENTTSPGNYYYNSTPNVNSAYFHADFKFRVLFEGGFSGAPFAWVDDFTFRADADGYSTMIPCGLSFWNEPTATSYGQDPGATASDNSERGVELELDNSINIPPLWATEADDGDQVDQVFGVGESERVVFSVLSEHEINFAYPMVNFYAPSMGNQSSVMSKDNNYTGPGWKYYAVEYISCDLAGSSISEPTDQFRYYFYFDYGLSGFTPAFYHLNSSGIEVGGGATTVAERFDAPDVTSTDNCGLALPVELLSFSAFLQNRHVELEWATASESNSDYFLVERSQDGVHFDPLKSVMAAENSNSLVHYEQLDFDPFPGISYYRLKQVDNDGDFTYSSISAVDIEKEESLIHPNPTSGFLVIDHEDIQQVQIASISGEIIETIQLNTNVIDVSELPRGIYLIRLSGIGFERIERFVKK